MQRVPVLSTCGLPLMPTKASRARRMVAEGKATSHWSDIGIYYIKLTTEASDNNTQLIAVGVDPGKLFSGIAVQSSKYTLCSFHLELPFLLVKERMETRKMLRRGRRSRRFNRKLPYHLRNHRQKRFSNRRKSKLPPSIRANRQLELRVITEISKLYPVGVIVYEYVKAAGTKSFSPVMVGQKWMINQCKKIENTVIKYGYDTSNMREHLGLVKEKVHKGRRTPETHAIDGIALACTQFLSYGTDYHTGKCWTGAVELTKNIFKIVRRLPINRRSLHRANFNKDGIRTRYGGTVVGYGLRKGDLVSTPKGMGYVSGCTKNLISVSDHNWKRISQIVNTKVKLIRRNIGLIVC